MKIIFSPTKTMKTNPDLVSNQRPFFLKESNELLKAMKKLSIPARKKVWGISSSLFEKATLQLDQTITMQGISPAIYTYQGLSFQHISANAMTEDQLAYLQDYFRILSAMYGVLRPLDGIVPYRLEMQKSIDQLNLYKFWSKKLVDYFQGEEIINVASKEYSDALLKEFSGNVIHIVFGHLENGNLKTKATLAKMGRGDLIYYMSEKKVLHSKDLRQSFDHYEYREDLSDEDHIVYLYE